MRRTTVKLPDELDALLRHEAQSSGRTVSEVTRAAITQYLSAADGPARRQLLSAGAGRSGRSDISDILEEILRQELGQQELGQQELGQREPGRSPS
ncbi:MAG TPA: CopG family transcriptional regulator [Actinomycetota bacterium]|nr:CopG family transcriptional regulator [Actinomycetota bacterium]